MSNQSDSLESVVIGDGVVVKGAFTVPSKAVINGVIEGDLTAEEVLIGPTGRITGRVSAKVIDVRGELHNTIVSEKALLSVQQAKSSAKSTMLKSKLKKVVKLKVPSAKVPNRYLPQLRPIPQPHLPSPKSL